MPNAKAHAEDVSLDIGHWALVIHWSLGIGHWSFNILAHALALHKRPDADSPGRPRHPDSHSPSAQAQETAAALQHAAVLSPAGRAVIPAAQAAQPALAGGAVVVARDSGAGVRPPLSSGERSFRSPNPTPAGGVRPRPLR